MKTWYNFDVAGLNQMCLYYNYNATRMTVFEYLMTDNKPVPESLDMHRYRRNSSLWLSKHSEANSLNKF